MLMIYCCELGYGVGVDVYADESNVFRFYFLRYN